MNYPLNLDNPQTFNEKLQWLKLGRVYFGELTFYHHTGMVEFEPKEYDYTMGSWIQLKTDK